MLVLTCIVGDHFLALDEPIFKAHSYLASIFPSKPSFLNNVHHVPPPQSGSDFGTSPSFDNFSTADDFGEGGPRPRDQDDAVAFECSRGRSNQVVNFAAWLDLDPSVIRRQDFSQLFIHNLLVLNVLPFEIVLHGVVDYDQA